MSHTSLIISENSIKDITDKIETMLKLNISSTPYAIVSDKILQIGTDIYTYLIVCPPKLHLLHEELFKTASTKQIILIWLVFYKPHKVMKEKAFSKYSDM